MDVVTDDPTGATEVASVARPAVIEIDDVDDPRVAAYVGVRDRDVSGHHDGFIAEGDVVVRVLIERGRYAIRSLLISGRRRDRLDDVVAGLDPSVPIYVAAQPVMDAIVGFSMHRGLLALGARGPGLDADTLLASLPPSATVVGVIGLANHDNMGGIFRNAAAFGAAAVLLDQASCDPLYRKAIRVSAGHALAVPFARCPSAGAMLDALAAHGFEAIALSPSGAERIDTLAAGPRRAILVGAEGPGLPADILARTRAVRIHLAAGVDSLNVSVACAIALHALTPVTR